MSNWIRFDNVDLGWPVVNFTMSSRQASLLMSRRNDLVFNSERPEDVERSVLKLVSETWPEYAEGGILLAMGMYGGLKMTFCYAHGALPRQKGCGLHPPNWMLTHRCETCKGPIREDYSLIQPEGYEYVAIETPDDPKYIYRDGFICADCVKKRDDSIRTVDVTPSASWCDAPIVFEEKKDD